MHACYKIDEVYDLTNNAMKNLQSGSYQGSFYAFKHMMRPLRIVLQDPQSCQSYHLMYAASAKMSLASIQLDRMISSNACRFTYFQN